VSHVELMAAYALLLSAFFAILWRRELREQWKLFLQLFIGLIAGAIALAWLMYPFPL